MAKTPTTIWDPDGSAKQGYIDNGKTYYSDGSRIKTGATVIDNSGRQWKMTDSGGVATGYQANSPSKVQTSPTSYYDDYLKQQQQLIRQQEEAARKAEQERINQAVSANNAYIPQVQEQSDKQLHEAYLSYMKSKKNAPQTLSALGYTGGATESTLMGLDTGYQGVRTDLETARNQSLDQIRQNEQQIRSTGNANLSDLASQYYGQYAQASQNALNMAREQENLERQLSYQQDNDVMDKARLAAQYGDYSLLQQLGINPQQQGYQQSQQTLNPPQPAPTTYDDATVNQWLNSLAGYLVNPNANQQAAIEKVLRAVEAGSLGKSEANAILAKLGYSTLD
jgi:hypothetical protein